MFTQEELETFDIDGLRRLCRYFEIDINPKTKKKRLIELIAVYLKEHEKTDENAPPMSVQIKRIYDRLKEK